MSGEQMINDLKSAIDELWRQKCEAYRKYRTDYIRGEMNVISVIQRSINGVIAKNAPPNDLFGWLELMKEEEVRECDTQNTTAE